jgi:phosphoribosylformylglycinamidine synthase subunit PurSL
VPPTLLVSSLGVVDDVRVCVTLDPKAAGERLYLLGATREELGGSEYYGLMGDKLRGEPWIGSSVPRVEARPNLELYRRYGRAVRAGLVSAAASLGAGGLAYALSRMALAGNLGLEVNLEAVATEPRSLRADRLLYSESQGRILVSLDEDREAEFVALFRGMPCSCVGRVVSEGSLRIRGNGTLYLEAPIEDLRQAYKRTLDW